MDDDFYLPVPGAPVITRSEDGGHVFTDAIFVTCSACGATVTNQEYARESHRKFHWFLARIPVSILTDAVEDY